MFLLNFYTGTDCKNASHHHAKRRVESQHLCRDTRLGLSALRECAVRRGWYRSTIPLSGHYLWSQQTILDYYTDWQRFSLPFRLRFGYDSFVYAQLVITTIQNSHRRLSTISVAQVATGAASLRQLQRRLALERTRNDDLNAKTGWNSLTLGGPHWHNRRRCRDCALVLCRICWCWQRRPRRASTREIRPAIL